MMKSCGVWLHNQRQHKREGKLSPEREAKLDLLGNWLDSKKEIDEIKWNENLKKLEKFVKENERFPKREESCGAWLITQRANKRNKKLTSERESKLDVLGDWSETELDRKWNENLERLKKFVKENERFPIQKESGGTWLMTQRANKRNKKLTPEKEAKLDVLGDWSETEFDRKWNENYEKLKKFVGKNGRFPRCGEVCIAWLTMQKQVKRKGNLSKEREEKLDALGDWMTPVGREKITSIKRNEEEIKIKNPRT